MRAWLAVAVLAVGPVPLAAQCLLARPGSPFDFRAGGTTLFATDFSSDPVGDFPSRLEFLQGAMEVARWRGQPALKAASASALAVPLPDPLPESFTVEVGVVNRNTKQVGANTVKLYGGRVFLSDFETASARAEYGPVGWRVIGGGAQAEAQFDSDDADACIGQEVIVRLQVDGDRIRLFADERRLASLPRASFRRQGGLVVALEGRDDGDNAVYLTRIRISAGSPVTVAAGPTPGTSPGTPPAVPTAGSATTARAPGPPPAGDRARDQVPIDSTPATPVAPAGVRAQPMHYQGTMRVTWDPVPGAVGYTIVRWLKDGTYVGANPLDRPMYGPERTGGVTMELEQGEVGIGVIASFPDGRASPPSPAVPVAVPRFYGRYRLWVLGFRVTRETLDNPLEIDGKRDEVYLRAAVAERGPEGQLLGVVTEHRTRVHGDINNTAWRSPVSPTRRIRAGSASADGGLMTGDAFPTATPWQITPTASVPESFPILLWEGDLVQGQNSVQAALQLWESDDAVPEMGGYSPEAAALDAARPAAQRISPAMARRVLTSGLATMNLSRSQLLMITEPGLADLAPWQAEETPPAPRLPVVNRALAPLDSVAGRLFDLQEAVTGLDVAATVSRLRTDVVSFVRGQEQYLQLALNLRDRPLGIRRNEQGQWYANPAIMTLTAENIETEALRGNGPAGLGLGVYEFRFADQDPLPTQAPAGGRGIYVLYLKVERVR